MSRKRSETTLAGVEKAKVRISGSGNPFRPGAGSKPPHFAGREDDWRVFDSCLSCLQDGGVPLGPMVLFGPRGNGKTVLMHRMAEQAQGLGMNALHIDPQDVDSPEQLQLTLANAVEAGAGVPAGRSWQWGGKAGFGGAGVDGRKVETRTLPTPKARDSMLRLGETPTVILLDEAHRLSQAGGALLLRAEQSARGQGAKVQLVLAGTPDLPDALRRMEATFWDRLEQRRRPLGLLDRSASLAAVAKPLGASVTPAAGDEIMRLTSGYPYFLQIMGRSLWDALPPPRAEIDSAAVARAADEFVEAKDAYYFDRVADLEAKGLLMAAYEVARTARATGEGLRNAAVQEAVRRSAGGAADADRDHALVRGLRHEGFLWRDKLQQPWTWGIPTLAGCVIEYVNREYAPAVAAAKKTAKRQAGTSEPPPFG